MKHTEQLEEECSLFIGKCAEFKSKIGSLVSALSTHGDKIEKEKLRAIGQRNKVVSEVEDRKRQEIAIQAAIAEKRAELERYMVQLGSLEKVEAEQQALIEKLQNQ